MRHARKQESIAYKPDKKKINKTSPMENLDTALIRQRVTRVFRYVQRAKGNDI